MRHKIVHWHERTFGWHRISLESAVAMLLVVLMFTSPTSAFRLQERSVYMNSSEAGATTFYRMSWRYISPEPVGSVEMLFCVDPIPYRPCDAPTGMDVSGATLTDQTGETGFVIGHQSTNRIVLSRASVAPTDPSSSYTLDGVVNPTDEDTAFSVRLKTHTSIDASGPQIDFGSMRAQVTQGVTLETQVPPMLIFCLAGEVSDSCTSTNEVYYSEMGELSPNDTLSAQSQMAVGTNATAGFVITANGETMSSGTNAIRSLRQPTASQQGVNQFGINLVENSSPTVGKDPEGEWANAVASDDYGQSNLYKFQSGDIVAYSPNVSLMKKFTVSYIVNSDPNLRAGVYTTTLSFIASGRF